MRSILVIYLLVMTVFMSCRPQKIYHLGTGAEYQIKGNKYYIQDHFNYHDKILGNWAWSENNDSLLITFKEFEKYSYPESSKQYRDAIFGKYRYIRNGEKVIDIKKITTLPKYSISMTYRSPDNYIGIIYDPISNRSKKVKFNFINNTKAFLNIIDKEKIIFSEMDSTKIDFTLPTSIELIKIQN